MASTPTQIQRISVSTSGVQGNYNSGMYALTINGDGSRVAFFTQATNLFSGATAADYVLKDLTTGALVSLTEKSIPTLGSSGGGSNDREALSITPDGSVLVFGSTSDLLGIGDSTDQDIYRLDRTGDVITLLAKAPGAPYHGHSGSPEITDNGRYVVYSSIDNVIPQQSDGNGFDTDVFWYDTVTAQIQLISGSLDGSSQGNSDSQDAHVSNDGNWVVFSSQASSLRPDDTGGGSWQIFLRDIAADQLYLLTTDANGVVGNGESVSPEMSADGHYVVFSSNASNLVAGNATGNNVFLKDLWTGNFRVVNVSDAGIVVPGAYHAEMTPDGRYVVFESASPGLVTDGISNGMTQIYVKDMVNGQISLVSTNLQGQPSSTGASAAHISDDGQYIVFSTRAALLAEDTNAYEDVYRVNNPIYVGGTNLANDIVVNSPEGQTFSPGDGLDILLYGADQAYQLGKAGNGYVVTAADGTVDLLQAVERVRLGDQYVAIDIAENAGSVAKILAAVFGREAVANQEYAGIGLSLMDAGMSYEALAALAIGAAGANTREAVVSLLWFNLMDSPPTPEQAQPYIDMLDPDLSNVGTLGAIASDYAAEIGKVDLNALTETGLKYILY